MDGLICLMQLQRCLVVGSFIWVLVLGIDLRVGVCMRAACVLDVCWVSVYVLSCYNFCWCRV